MMKSELRSVDRCEQTDHYEASIMHRQALHVRWLDDGGEREARLLPYDLRAENGKDFLFARDQQGQELRICLDQVLQVREFRFQS